MINSTEIEKKTSAPMVSVSEAHSLSGISESMLNTLLKDGVIKGKLVGNDMKVYRLSLQAYLSREAKKSAGPTAKKSKSESLRAGASAGAVAGIDHDGESLEKEVWSLKKALATEKSEHEDTRTALFAERKEILRLQDELSGLRFEFEKLERGNDKFVHAAATQVDLVAASSAPVKKKVGFFAMLKRAFS